MILIVEFVNCKNVFTYELQMFFEFLGEWILKVNKVEYNKVSCLKRLPFLREI